MNLPDGVRYDFGGENEEIMTSVRQLGLMLVLGVVLVYFVMVAQFQSLKSPFIIMFTIPLAFTGGFLALLIAGFDVSIISLIGFVMLTGVIVNNGIVLVDYTNQLRAHVFGSVFQFDFLCDGYTVIGDEGCVGSCFQSEYDALSGIGG